MPEPITPLRENILLWQEFLGLIRGFFGDLAYAEVSTPKIILVPACEPQMESIATFPLGLNKPAQYLITSPEFAMKKLLAGGSGSIFQITPAFREGEKGKWHNPEFTMVEWYKIGANYKALMDETYNLIAQFLPFPLEKVSYLSAFQKRWGIDPLKPDITLWASKLGPLWQEPIVQELAKQNVDSLLDYLLAFHIQPELGQNKITFLYDFPLSQAPLARRNTDGRTAARFEVFHQGLELVNGCFELADCALQRQNFAAVNRERTALGKPEVALDEGLLAIIDQLPTCSGAAMGLERLFVLTHPHCKLRDLYHLQA